MSIAATMQDAMAQVNTALHGIDAPTGTRVFLLKRGEHTGVLSKVGSELTAGVYVEFDDNLVRNSGLFRYASSASIADNWAQATHVAYGVAVAGKLEVFEFVEDEKDNIEPSTFSPFYSGRISKVPNERWTIV